MYFFKPLTDEDEISKVYGRDCSYAYVGYEKDIPIGGCGFEIKGSYVIINKIVFDEDKPDFGEGLVRSALNYAANRDAYMARCECDNVKAILERMGFENKGDGGYEGDIPTLLGGTCCSGCSTP